MWKEVKYKKSEITQYVTLHHCRIALKMSEDIIFNIFHYFSGPTAKRDQPSYNMDNMKCYRPT